MTALRRCDECRLLYRTPTTSAEENERIYQTDYSQGFTTELPNSETLAALKESRFRGLEKDYSSVIEVLGALGGKAGDQLFDYGCSWGYGSWQLAQAGYRVDSYEISKPRRNYAVEKLGIRHLELADAAAGSYDFFFSSHVLEHVPSVAGAIELGMRLLKPSGMFVCFTPNGGRRFRDMNYTAFHKLWGFVHPQLLDVEYVQSAFSGRKYLVGSTPVAMSDLQRFPVDAPLALNDGGDELLIVALKG